MALLWLQLLQMPLRKQVKDLSSLSGLLLLMAVPDYHPPVVFEIAHPAIDRQVKGNNR
jgi:hypothetical protein